MTALRLVVFAAVLAPGCALTAVRPPSPAAAAPAEQVRAEAAALYPPGDRFYVAVFGSDRPIPDPARCHTWASAVRVSGGAVAERSCISWMPATLEIHPERRTVEPGVNLPHEGVLGWATGDGQRVTGWGPYPVTPECYHRLRMQADWLDAGGTAYQSVDTVGEAGRTGAGTNCIHAVMDLRAEFGRLRYPLVAGYGTTAGWWAAWRLRTFGNVLGGPDEGLRPHFGEAVRWRD